MKHDSRIKNVVQLDKLVFSYSDRNNRSPVFHCDSWSLADQERVFLYGDSGSGKSTLLNLLSGLLTPREGSVHILEKNLTKMSMAKRDKFRAQHLGIVYQQFNLIPYLSAAQNVTLAAYFAKSKEGVAEQMGIMMEFLKLPATILNKPVSELSVGQQQRVAIMRAFINQPDLLLIDEPTSSLDSSARDGFMSMLLNLSEQFQSSMVFVSHDPALRDHFHTQIALQDICRWDVAQGVSLC